jgi:hypothetical protein
LRKPANTGRSVTWKAWSRNGVTKPPAWRNARAFGLIGTRMASDGFVQRSTMRRLTCGKAFLLGGKVNAFPPRLSQSSLSRR